MRQICVASLLLGLGAKGIATRNKGATRGSWHYYYEQIAISSILATSFLGTQTRNPDLCDRRGATMSRRKVLSSMEAQAMTLAAIAKTKADRLTYVYRIR